MLYQLISGRSAFVSFLLSSVVSVLFVTWSLSLDTSKSEYFYYSAWMHLAIQQVLVIVIGWWTNRLLLKHKLVPIGDYSASFLLIILLSTITGSIEHFRVLLGLLFSIVLIGKVKSVFNQQNGTVAEFEIGILAATAYLSHPVFVFALPFALIAVLLAKANDWRDYLAVFTGFCFILFLKACYYVFTDKVEYIPKIMALNFKLKNIQFSNYAELGLLFFGFLVASVSVNQNLKSSDKMNIKDRIYYKLWFSLFGFMLPPFLVLNSSLNSVQTLSFVLFPLVVLIQPYLHKKRKALVQDGMLVLFISFCVFSALYNR